MKSIVLTGGGTAGHVTPNLALIPKLQQEGYKIHYFGTSEGMERAMVEKFPGVNYHVVRSGKLRRYFSWQNFVDPFKVIGGYFDSKKALKTVKPSIVFSKGGFVSVPVGIAANRCKIPVVLHESDYSPGLANRIAITYANKVLVTFEDTLNATRNKGVFTGTPIRSSLYTGDRQKALDLCGFSGDKPILLITGGSQGAQAINQAIHANLNALTETFDVIHLCGKGKQEHSLDQTPGYRQFEFVSSEMPDILAASDMIISRAGANSIFEFLALAKPALLIPLPMSASRGDQIQNADYFKQRGYSDVLLQEDMSADPSLFMQKVMALYENRQTYIESMQHAKNANGTDAVLNELYALVKN